MRLWKCKMQNSKFKMGRFISLILYFTFCILNWPGAAGEHAHEHKPPHGGTLIVLGEEFAHLELLLDAETGKLTAYVLGGEPTAFVRIRQKGISLQIGPDDASGSQKTVTLKAVANLLTGEEEGNTSQFEAVAAELKGLKQFKGCVRLITVKGTDFRDVAFAFPGGNERHSDEPHK